MGTTTIGPPPAPPPTQIGPPPIPSPAGVDIAAGDPQGAVSLDDLGAVTLLLFSMPGDGSGEPRSGWASGAPDVDPFTNVPSGDIDPYTGSANRDDAPNGFTGGRGVDPFLGVPSPDRSASSRPFSINASGDYETPDLLRAGAPDVVDTRSVDGEPVDAVLVFRRTFTLASVGLETGVHELTPDELAALVAKYREYDKELDRTAPAARAPDRPDIGDPTSPWSTSTTPAALDRAPDPSPGLLKPLPPVSAPDERLFVDHGAIWRQYREAAREVANPTNSLWERGTLAFFATLASPLAYAEEYVARPIANIPYAVHNNGIKIGEYGARAWMNFERGETAEGTADALSAVASFAVGFLVAAQAALPAASALETPALGNARGVSRAALSGELESALPAERPEALPRPVEEPTALPNVPELDALFGQKVQQGANQVLTPLKQGDASGLKNLLSRREYRATIRALEGENEPSIAQANVGKAIERLVAQMVRSDPLTAPYFDYVAGPGRPDFYGKGVLEGLFWDVTTVAARWEHQYGRWYSPRTFVHSY